MTQGAVLGSKQLYICLLTVICSNRLIFLIGMNGDILDMIRLIINNGADVNAYYGVDSTLQSNIRKIRRSIKIINLLINSGADRNIINNKGIVHILF